MTFCALVPQNVTFLLSTQQGSVAHNSVLRRDPQVITVTALDMLDKPLVVRKTLEAHGKQLDESPFNNQVLENRNNQILPRVP